LDHSKKRTEIKIARFDPELEQVLSYMHDNDIDIDCHTITNFWLEEWVECPLCGGKIEKLEDGSILFVHYGRQ
jgi:hypothetical protein